MKAKINQQLNGLKYTSPLKMASALKELELYDKKEARQVIDEVYKQYATGEKLQEEVVTPVMLSVLDGLFESTKFGRQARRKGLTSSRIISECRSFSYGGVTSHVITNDGYVEFKNMRDNRRDANKGWTYHRRELENKNEMDKYKNQKFAEVSGKNAFDEYRGTQDITQKRNNPDRRRNDPKNDYQAEVDHIIPLKKIGEQYSSNYALTTDDIRRIANSEDNFALTSAYINGKKLEKTNTEFVNANKDVLSPETQKLMLEKEEKAQMAIESRVNEEVLNTLKGEGNSTRQVRKLAYKEEEERLGEKLTKTEREAINKRLAIEKRNDVYWKLAGDAVTQQKDYMTGNIILYIVKPLYYELSDIVKNGLKDGVNASSFMEAMRIRFSRVKTYVVENAKSFMGDNVLDFVKGFISSLIEGIIGLFTGFFRNVLKLCKEGIRILTSSLKIVKGEEGAHMTSAEKKQAIAKLVGGGIIAVLGIVLEEQLAKIISRDLAVVASTILSGVAATLFFYFLNKIDLFSVKAEKRYARIEEIFDERIKDIETATGAMNVVALETLQQQRNEFDSICSNIRECLANDDVDAINDGWYRMAEFMRIDLPYKNTDEFLDYMDDSGTINL
ncbi:MAG: hypothetical protein IJU00_00835 [Selenomonas sp.]|nr:hypothetical protein [Selenomonas sp.]